jgi:hypothetical protein
MPVLDYFRPTLFVAPPLAYAIAPSERDAVTVLRAHGIVVDSLPTMHTARADRFIADSTIVSPRVFQKHHEVRLTGRWMSERRELRPGTYIVRANQPLGIVATYLLEPQTDDGLVTWNVFDEAMTFGGTYPVLRLMSEPQPTGH